jgi:hypothetical protein
MTAVKAPAKRKHNIRHQITSHPIITEFQIPIPICLMSCIFPATGSIILKPCRREKEEATLRLAVGGILRLCLTASNYPFRKGPGIFPGGIFKHTHAYARLIRVDTICYQGGKEGCDNFVMAGGACFRDHVAMLEEALSLFNDPCAASGVSDAGDLEEGNIDRRGG